MPAASSSPTMAWIPGHSKPTLATATFSTRSDTRSWRPIGSRGSFGIEVVDRAQCGAERPTWPCSVPLQATTCFASLVRARPRRSIRARATRAPRARGACLVVDAAPRQLDAPRDNSARLPARVDFLRYSGGQQRGPGRAHSQAGQRGTTLTSRCKVGVTGTGFGGRCANL